MQADLEAIRTALLQRRGALLNLTGDEATLEAARPHVAAFLDSLPAEAASPSDWAQRLPRLNEAITVPTQVPLPLPALCSCWSAGHSSPAPDHADGCMASSVMLGDPDIPQLHMCTAFSELRASSGGCAPVRVESVILAQLHGTL